MTITIGSRESALAIIQSQIVMSAIQAAHPDLTLELVTMKTTGDKILDRTLDKIGGKGLFVKELSAALREGRVDLTVHSCKDFPMEEDPELPLVAFSRREDPRDVLVLPAGQTEIDFSKPIGCSSLRRCLQFQVLFPQAQMAPVRGNVPTRLRKLDEGQFSALILAGAGLKRLGLEDRICRVFSPEEILPAAGQGILAVQSRSDFDLSLLSCVDDADSRDCALSERAFVHTLDGGCSSPVAAYATVTGETITIDGIYVDDENQLYRGTISGSRREGPALATELARQLKEGAQCVVK